MDLLSRATRVLFIRSGKTKLADLRAWKPNGVICPARRLDLIRPLRIPVVAFDINDYDGSIPGVLSEDLKAGRLAAEHLLGLGLDRFAFCGFEPMRWSQQRREAFCQTIETAGHRVEIFQPRRRQPINWAKEEPLLRDWLAELPKPIGLFCANDDRAASILESCRALGFGVPEDIAVIGVDDDPYICEWPILR